MGETVKVAVRARPLVPKEIEEGSQTCLRFVPGTPQLSLGDKSFTFDYVFPPLCQQGAVYDQCVSCLLDSVFRGINATVLAYGQTGSGKTYTMGTFSDEMGGCEETQLGIIPRVITDLFDGIAQRPQYDAKVRVSFLEIYNELIRDLLNPHGSEPLGIREEPCRGIYIQGLTEQEVASAQQISRCLAEGADSRVVGQTAMNERSSRSHAIFTIHLSMQHRDIPEDALSAKFHLVDLAGSERAKKTQAEGERFREGININMGLSCLGNVISALCKHSSHVPYRDSKLTRLLQDSLGGNSRTLMIACVSPADTNFEETLNSLRYADRARQIKNKPVVNRDPQQAEILRLRAVVKLLKGKLNEEEVAEIERQVSAEAIGQDPSSAAPIPNALSSVGCTVCSSGSVISAAEYQKVCERCRQLSAENKELTEQAGKAVDQATQLYMSMAVLEHVQDVMLSRLEKWKAQLVGLSASGGDQVALKDVQRMVQNVLTAAAATASGAAAAAAAAAAATSSSASGAAGVSAGLITAKADLGEGAGKGEECDEATAGVADVDVDVIDPDDVVVDDDDVVMDGDEVEDDEEEEEELIDEDPLMQQKKTVFTQKMQNLKSQMTETLNAIASLSRNSRQDEAKYEAQIKELEERISKLEAERTELLRQANDAKQADVRKVKLRELEAKLAEARRELTDYNRLKREKEKRDLEMGRLKDEMQKLKQTQVRLVKQMHADSLENRRRHMEKDAQQRQLQATLRRNEAATMRMRQQYERQLAVAKRRGDEMSKHLRSQRQREALAVERLFSVGVAAAGAAAASAATNGLAGSCELMQGKLTAWLSDEMEAAVSAADLRRHLNLLMEERRQAAASGNQAAVTALNGQIAELQSLIAKAPAPDLERARWNSVKSLTEARLLLGEAFQRAVEARVAAAAAESGLKETKEELEQCLTKVQLLEKRKVRESISGFGGGGSGNVSIASGCGASSSRQSKIRRDSSRLSRRVDLLDAFQPDDRLPSFDETSEDTVAIAPPAPAASAPAPHVPAEGAFKANIDIEMDPSAEPRQLPAFRVSTPPPSADGANGVNRTLEALQESLQQSAHRIRQRGLSLFPQLQSQPASAAPPPTQLTAAGGRVSDRGCKCRSDCSTARCGCRRSGSGCGQLCKCAISQCSNGPKPPQPPPPPPSQPQPTQQQAPSRFSAFCGDATFSLDDKSDDGGAGKENELATAEEADADELPAAFLTSAALPVKRPPTGDVLNATFDLLPTPGSPSSSPSNAKYF